MKGWRSIFQSFPYGGAQKEVLRTFMIFAVAVGVAKAINLSCTITVPTIMSKLVYLCDL